MANDIERVLGWCRICGEDKPVRNKNLFVFGSEGVWACHECEMEVNEFVQQRQRFHGDRRKEKFKARKQAEATR